MNWAAMKLRHDAFKMNPFPPSLLAHTVAGRFDQVMNLLSYPVVDEETGTVEYVQLISTEVAKKMLDSPIASTARARPKGRSRR